MIDDQNGQPFTCAELGHEGPGMCTHPAHNPEPPRSPSWHMDEAEAHLAAAEKLADRARTDPEAAASLTRRLLAASAQAQLGALKLALQQDVVLVEMRSVLYDIVHNTTR